MSTKDDGGSAFPEVFTDLKGDRGEYSYDVYSAGGMTLRDYFAAKAMLALVSGESSLRPDQHAHRAFQIADAMLKARHV